MTAVEKLKAELTGLEDKRLSRQEAAMAKPVEEMLEAFCAQDARFSQTVENCKGTLTDCMKAVGKDVRYAISDVEAYRRAVQFYFPGAEVDFKCVIVLPSEKREPGKVLRGIGVEQRKEEKREDGIITVSLLDLL